MNQTAKTSITHRLGQFSLILSWILSTFIFIGFLNIRFAFFILVDILLILASWVLLSREYKGARIWYTWNVFLPRFTSIFLLCMAVFIMISFLQFITIFIISLLFFIPALSYGCYKLMKASFYPHEITILSALKKNFKTFIRYTGIITACMLGITISPYFFIIAAILVVISALSYVRERTSGYLTGILFVIFYYYFIQFPANLGMLIYTSVFLTIIVIIHYQYILSDISQHTNSK